MPLEPQLTPPPVRGQASSVARVTEDWYVVCRSEELGKKPIQSALLGTPLAIFRTSGGVGALLDRCPHRNVPLSLGAVSGDRLECGYHGWEFDLQGRCRHIPCLIGDPDAKARRVASYAAREQDGFVWVYGEPDVEPARDPYRFPFVDDPRYTQAGADVIMEGTVHATAENALDVPHTAYLHGGLFRKPGIGRELEVTIRRWGEGCEAEYAGEDVPPGLIGKALAPGGGQVTHFDRFLLPSITQVEYALGEDSHVMISSALTPVSDYVTKLYGQVAIRTPIKIPMKIVAQVLRPLAMVILKQDAKMLKKQSEATQRFGGEQLVSTDVDVLGPHILRLLKDAEKGKRGGAPDDDEVFEKKMSMRV